MDSSMEGRTPEGRGGIIDNDGGRQGQGPGPVAVRVGPRGRAGNVEGSGSRGRGNNWEYSQILALVQAKKAEHDEEVATLDMRLLLRPAQEKWDTISEKVMSAGNLLTHRDGKACKEKWKMLLKHSRQIVDYHNGPGHNTAYWGLTSKERQGFRLPKVFDLELYKLMESFLADRALNTCAHVRDLMEEQNAAEEDAEGTQEFRGSFQGMMTEDIPCDITSNTSNFAFTPTGIAGLGGMHNEERNIFSSPSSRPSASNSRATERTPRANFPPGVTPTRATTQVKRKRSSAFSPMVDASKESTALLCAALEKSAKTQETLLDKQLAYYAKRDEDYNNNQKEMIKVFGTWTKVMAHAFIKDQEVLQAVLADAMAEGVPPAATAVSEGFNGTSGE